MLQSEHGQCIISRIGLALGGRGYNAAVDLSMMLRFKKPPQLILFAQNKMRRETMSAQPASNIDWQKRFFIALTILAWIVIAGFIIWGMGRIAGTIILLTIAALLSYILFPLVKLL